MTILAARVARILHDGEHRMGAVAGGELKPSVTFPRPSRVEIDLPGGPDEPCMVYRYTDSDEFCGDTWHENLPSAFAQVAHEYGLGTVDFSERPVGT